MFKHCKGIIAGVLIGATVLGAAIANADNITKSINAIYMNVKLVINGCAVTPKDANGNVVEPFIYNGTTYLPVRAVAEALGQNVDWDGDTATVFIGGKVDKPALEFYFYERPYIECKDPANYSANAEYDNYVDLYVNPGDWSDRVDLGNSRLSATNYVVYPLNGLAKTVKGTFTPPTETRGKPETQFRFYNENGTLLYISPIMTNSTKPIDFEFDVSKCLTIKVEATVNQSYYMGFNPYVGARANIDNFRVVTTDY